MNERTPPAMRVEVIGLERDLDGRWFEIGLWEGQRRRVEVSTARAQRLALILAGAAPSAPLIPQSRAEEMVAEEREECIRLFRENLEPLICQHLDNDVACGLRDAEEAIRARKTEATP